MRGRRLEGTKVDRDRQRQQVIEEVDDRQATEGRNCGSAKGSKQEKSSSCYGGKSQGEVGDFILSAILMLVSEWERITKDVTKGTQRTRWDLRDETHH